MCKELNCAYLTLMENKWTPGLGKLQETRIQQLFICHTMSRDPATPRESAVLLLFTLTTSDEEGYENVLAISRPLRGLKHLKTCMCEHHRRRSPRESRRVTAAAASSHHIKPPTAHTSVFTSEPWCQWKMPQMPAEPAGQPRVVSIPDVLRASASRPPYGCVRVKLAARAAHSPWRSLSDGSGRACGPGRSR